MAIGTASPMVECALWIRAAERLQIAEDPLVPGPLDIDRPPPPISTGDEVVCEQWLSWWYSLVAPLLQPQPLDIGLEPALDTPDPLGLAPFPVLAALVAKRWPQVREWQIERQRHPMAQRDPHSMLANDVVRELERAWGRRVRPFSLDFVLLPVRDDEIRKVDEERYLVPERVYHGPGWEGWLRDLVTRIG
jgi:hypothetical protein